MRIIINLVKQLLFWLIVFSVQRIIFLFYYLKLLKVDHIHIGEVLQSFYHALSLDISTACYILVIPFFIYLVQRFYTIKWLNVFHKIYTALALLLYLMISAGELGLYGEWKTKLSYKALAYFRHPDEVFNSATTTEIVLFFTLVTGQFILFYFLYKKYVFSTLPPQKRHQPLLTIGLSLLTAFLLFYGIRDGLKAIPITVSEPYFSRHNILNQTAVNSGYSLAFNIIDYLEIAKHNFFKTIPDAEAEKIVKSIHYTKKDTTINILRIKRPNIVLVLLESFSGDLIESLGGDPRIAPRFHHLEKDGLLFTNFYATGNRSQQAIGSLYAGLPALPVTTLSDHPEKYKAFPSLIQKLKKAGYYSSFYFAGQLEYGNIKSFLSATGFDRLVEGKDFDASLPRGSLGVPDGYMFPVFLKAIGKMPRPFFANAFTISSHSPYDQPGGRPLTWVKIENKFVNSAHYTDKCLGDFIEQAKQQTWWDSTLVIILADHSHMSYHNYPLWSFKYHHIPLLLTGGALDTAWRGKQYNRLCSNVDVPATILHQFGLSSDDFFWSKNAFNPYSPQFAFFELHYGFGWKRTYGEIVMNITNNYYYEKNVPKSKKNTLEKEGRAYVQYLLESFLKK